MASKVSDALALSIPWIPRIAIVFNNPDLDPDFLGPSAVVEEGNLAISQIFDSRPYFFVGASQDPTKQCGYDAFTKRYSLIFLQAMTLPSEKPKNETQLGNIASTAPPGILEPDSSANLHPQGGASPPDKDIPQDQLC